MGDLSAAGFGPWKRDNCHSIFGQPYPPKTLELYRRSIFLSLTGVLEQLPPGKMRPPIRIAVLECDTPMPDVVQEFGTYGNIFENLLKAGADALGQPDVITAEAGLQVTKWDVVNNEDSYPALDDVDAVLLSGSSE